MAAIPFLAFIEFPTSSVSIGLFVAAFGWLFDTGIQFYLKKKYEYFQL
jgi:hypothetical protein